MNTERSEHRRRDRARRSRARSRCCRERQRHGEDRLASADAHGSRGEQIRESPRSGPRSTRLGRRSRTIAAVDGRGRARGQQARGEQVALARRHQPRPGKHVHVLVDQLADRTPSRRRSARPAIRRRAAAAPPIPRSRAARRRPCAPPRASMSICMSACDVGADRRTPG